MRPGLIAASLVGLMFAACTDGGTTAGDADTRPTPPDDTTAGDTTAGDTTVSGDTTPPNDTTPPADTTPPPAATYKTFIGDWTMPRGQEATRCVEKRLDNEAAIAISAIHTELSQGSHHLIIYRSNASTERPQPFPCTPFVGGLGGNEGPLMITQIPKETLRFPPGIAMELAPRQMIRIEAHYLNYYEEPITAHADVTFETTTSYDQLADFLFFGTTSFSLPEGETTIPWRYLDAPNGAKVFALTGHTHRWGTNVEISQSTGLSDAGTPIYPGDDRFKWDEAPIVPYDPPLIFEQGSGFRFRCSWDNQSGGTVGFGQSANQEMCFFWAYYYPSQGYVVCADGLFDYGCPKDG